MFLRRKATEPLSDEDLVARLKGGQRSSLAALWDRYAQLLFGVGMKYLRDTEQSKDVVVELFGTLPELLMKHEVKSFRPWIHAVVRNRCLMLLRKREPVEPLSESAELEGSENTDDAVLHEATLQRLEAAIGELNEAQRQCIRFFYLERSSYAQVAERTGLSIEQVRSHLQNGRRNLRIILSQHADQDHQ